MSLLLLLRSQGEAPPVSEATAWIAVAGEAFVAGGDRGETFMSGGQAAEAFVAGGDRGETHGD